MATSNTAPNGAGVTQGTARSKPNVARRRRYATLARQAFPTLDSIPDRYRFKMSRIRNETSAFAAEELVELMRSQAGTKDGAARMALLIEDLLDQYEAIFGELNVCLIDAFMAEQADDGREDVSQLGAAHDPARLLAWIEDSRSHAAKARVARAAALRTVEAR